LLGVGTAVGYRFGLQAVVRHVPIVTPVPRHAELIEQLRIYHQLAHVMKARSGAVVESAAAHVDSLPPGVKYAIDGLVEATTQLGKQLEHFGAASHIGKPPIAAVLPPQQPAQYSAAKSTGDMPQTATAIVANQQPKLTGDEINKITQSAGSLTNAAADHPNCRYPYDCFQTVFAWYGEETDGPTTPGIKVRCRDISSHGIAFLLPDNPDFERLIISLGDDKNPIYMGAEVSHSRSVCMHGQVSVLVGCRFTGRVSPAVSRNLLLPDDRRVTKEACTVASYSHKADGLGFVVPLGNEGEKCLQLPA